MNSGNVVESDSYMWLSFFQVPSKYIYFPPKK